MNLATHFARFQPEGLRRLALLAGLALGLAAQAANQYPPGKLTFQGHLADAAGQPLGLASPTNVLVQFRLYRSATGAAPADLLWAEQQSVKVSGGFFTALLGGGAPTGVAGEFYTNNLAGLFLGPDASERYLGLTVVGQGAEIAPRMQFLSSPFAHLSRASAALLDTNGQPIVATAPGAVGINLNGAAPGSTLDVGGTVKASKFVGDGSALTGVNVAAANVTGTFGTAQLADGSIGGSKIVAGSVGTTQLAPGAVTAAKLAPDAATAIAGIAGGVANGGTILSSNKVDATLLNMGYVNVGRAGMEGDKWTMRATAATPNAPAPRLNTIGSSDHRASATLWTGTKWVVYSGMNMAQNGYLTDGAIFDPALNTWTPVSTVGAPAPRNEISFIWTGTKGLFWGGHNGAPMTNGAIFDPTLNTWSPLSFTNQPTARNRFRAVWTGTEMFVWGGEINNNINACYADGKLYNPVSNTWRNVSTAPLSGRRDFNAFWTGKEVLIWGGCAANSVQVNSGALYNPTTDTWRLMTTSNAPAAREAGEAVWTGKEFIVWGGTVGSPVLTDGGRYNPDTDTWIPFSTPNYPGFSEGAAFWSGTKVYFVQGRTSAGYVNELGGGFMSGLSFDPANNTWGYLPQAPTTQGSPPHAWTGSELLTFATFRNTADQTVLSFKPDKEVYFYSKTGNTTDKWNIHATKDAPNAPVGRVNGILSSSDVRSSQTVWTGSKWIVWGGQDSSQAADLKDGGFFDPVANAWQRMNASNAPSARHDFSMVWTGAKAIVWGGFGPTNFISDGRSYDLAGNTWGNLNSTNAPSPRSRHAAVWAGNQMIVWGGNVATGTGVTNNGARYNPTSDTWTNMAACPLSARADCCVQWTGTEMLIWGGGSASQTNVFGDGALYNPVSNTWRTISMSNAPAPRTEALGVWTGTEFIVWGGSNPTNSAGNDGGRYNPATDTWVPFNTGSYRWQCCSAAVWTGTKVLYAGGIDGNMLVNLTGKGGITYNPTTGVIGTLPVAPLNQRAVPFTWTGTELLTFGAWDDFLDQTVLGYQPQP